MDTICICQKTDLGRQSALFRLQALFSFEQSFGICTVRLSTQITFLALVRLILDVLNSKKKYQIFFANQIRAKFVGGLKYDSNRILQMHLSPDALVAQIRFPSVFCVTRNTTHNNDVKSRVTEVHRSTLLPAG